MYQSSVNLNGNRWVGYGNCERLEHIQQYYPYTSTNGPHSHDHPAAVMLKPVPRLTPSITSSRSTEDEIPMAGQVAIW